jgi:hypothetical protein
MLHSELRSHSFMQTQFQASQEFEWSPMTALVLNKNGLFKVDSARAVFEIDKFWAIGTAEAFALGAMQATYNDPKLTASDIAGAALEVTSKFSPSDCGEIRLLKLPIETKNQTHQLDDDSSLFRKKSSTKSRKKRDKKEADENALKEQFKIN